jgi:hypothetical protein
MPDVPAICDQCGTVFSSGFGFTDVINATLVGNMLGRP